MVHFLDLSSVNESLKAIKNELNKALFLMYLRNENQKEIYELIDEKIIKQKMLWQILKKNTVTPKVELSNQFSCLKFKVNSELADFFIDCFKHEWDENVNEWLRTFDDSKHKKAIYILQDNLNKQIASSVMYWVFEKNIYIFLIGTKSEYRRLKLGQFLMKKVQEKYPEKEIQLTVFKDAKAYNFYQKLGFEDGGVSGVWF